MIGTARKKQETLVLFPEVLSITQKFTDEQFGILMRAAFSYRFAGEVYSGDDVAVDVAFRTVASQIDRYQEFCNTQSMNAKGSEVQRSAAKYSQIQQKSAKYSQSQPSDPPIHVQSMSNPCPIQSNESMAGKPPAPAKQARKSYGEFGWVKLTDDEYNRLLNDLGEAEVKRCIAYVDESAQATGNKNKWRDWNLVVRKCHKQGWGLNQQQKGGYESGVDRLARMYKEEFGE